MRGTDFEFRHRFWFILLIFLLAFSVYAFEPVNAVDLLLRTLGEAGVTPGFVPGIPAAHAIFGLGAVLVPDSNLGHGLSQERSGA
jgi:hypothetical protein